MTDCKVVIDTNILISRLLLPKSVPAIVVRYILENGKVLLSDKTLEELTSVLFRKKFDKYISTEARKLFIEGLNSISVHVEIEKSIKVCRDPNDNKFLDVTVNGEAECIIAGDLDLLILNIFENIRIIKAKDFFTLIARD